MRTRLIQIGNSRGIRLPKPLIAQAGLSEEVDLQIQDGAILVSRIRTPRAGWADAAIALNQNNEDKLLHENRPTEFDETEWTW